MGHLAERLDDERLRRHRCGKHARREEVRNLPVHPKLFGEDSALLDRGHDLLRERRLSAPLHRNRRKRLRLESEVGPLLPKVRDKLILRLLVLRGRDASEGMHVHPADVESVHAERNLVALLHEQTLLDVLRHPAVERLCCRCKEAGIRNTRKVVEPCEAGEDVKRDVVRGRSAREPRPASVAVARKAQLLDAARLLVLEPILSEEIAKARTRGGLVLRLAHPWRLLERDRLEVFVRLKRTLQRLRARCLPFVEHRADSRIGVRDVRPERVRVVAAERLLAALVRELHEVGKRQHRVPRRTRHGAHREVLMADRIGTLARDEVLELERLRRVPAHV